MVGLIATSIITSILSREEYGIYQYVLGIVASLGFIGLTGFDQVLMREVAQGKHGALDKVLRRRFLFAPLYVVALLLIAAYYVFWDNQPLLAIGFAIVSIPLPLKSVLQSYQPYLLGRKNYSLYARLPVVASIALSIATAGTAWLTQSPIWVLAAAAVTQLVIHSLLLRYVYQQHGPSNQDFSESAIAFGTKLSGLNILPTIAAKLDVMLVGLLLTLPDVAILAMAALPRQKSKIMVRVFGEVFAPRVVAKEGPEMFRRANWAIAGYLGVVALFVAVLIVLMPYFYQLFFPTYLDTVPLARLAMLSMLPSVPAAVMDWTINTEERLDQAAIVRVAQFIFDLAVMFICIRLWGVAGAFIAKILGGLLRTAVTSRFYISNYRAAQIASTHG